MSLTTTTPYKDEWLLCELHVTLKVKYFTHE